MLAGRPGVKVASAYFLIYHHFNLSVRDEPNILTFAPIVTRPLYQ